MINIDPKIINNIPKGALLDSVCIYNSLHGLPIKSYIFHVYENHIESTSIFNGYKIHYHKKTMSDVIAGNPLKCQMLNIAYDVHTGEYVGSPEQVLPLMIDKNLGYPTCSIQGVDSAGAILSYLIHKDKYEGADIADAYKKTLLYGKTKYSHMLKCLINLPDIHYTYLLKLLKQSNRSECNIYGLSKIIETVTERGLQEMYYNSTLDLLLFYTTILYEARKSLYKNKGVEHEEHIDNIICSDFGNSLTTKEDNSIKEHLNNYNKNINKCSYICKSIYNLYNK